MANEPSWETLSSLSDAMFVTITLKWQGRTLTYWLVDSARGLPTREQFERLLRQQDSSSEQRDGVDAEN
jgi:hypothetical protein